MKLSEDRQVADTSRPTTRLRIRPLLSVSLLGLLLAASAGCSTSQSKAEPITAAEDQAPEADQTAQGSAVNVRVLPVQAEQLEETFSLIGQTYAEDAVTLSAETMGRVDSMRVEVGDRVRRDQVVARVDFRLLKARVDQAEADHVLAHKTLDRMKQLRDKKAVAQQAVDEAIARDHLVEASLRLAEAELSKSTIRSPVSGVVVAKRVQKGEYVNPGQPMLEITDLTSVKVRANAPASLVARLRPDLPVQVNLPALSHRMQGRIELVVPVASGSSRTFEVRVALDKLDRQVPVGLDARLTVQAQVHDQALVVPQAVVLERSKSQRVFVAEGERAVSRVVDLGPVVGQRVLVRSGLRQGDLLIVDGHRDLIDGQPIRLVD